VALASGPPGSPAGPVGDGEGAEAVGSGASLAPGGKTLCRRFCHALVVLGTGMG